MLRRFLCCVVAAAAGLLGSGLTARAAEELTIGSEAPALDIAHWVQDGKGKFKPVTKFESGKVYVVEFWATWCGPCIMSMPHLAETQTKYADKGVQIVSISDEELETVEKFLDRKVRGETESEKTYRDLTSVYCLTTDPDQSAYLAYMEASGQQGIPTAFIVGKDKKIEWIGHPMEMDEPLESVVNGKWDRQKFADDYKSKQEMDKVMQQASLAMRARNFKKALELIEQAISKSKEPSQALGLQIGRLQIAAQVKEMRGDLPKIAAETFKAVSAEPQAVNQAAWMLVTMMENDVLDKDKALIQSALAATTEAAKAGEGDSRAGVMDTLAHLQYLNGDLDAAMATQKAALEIASAEGKKELQGFLKQLEEAKAQK